MYCIFCNIASTLQQNVVWQDNEFWILYDGFPIADPHLLVIPKAHVSWYGLLPPDQFPHVESMLTSIEKKLEKPVLFFEHGDIGQTVKHAHIHAIPFAGDVDAAIAPLKFTGETRGIASLSDLTAYPAYLFFKKGNQLKIFLPQDAASLEPAPITNALARLFGKPTPAANRPPPTKEAIENVRKLFSGGPLG